MRSVLGILVIVSTGILSPSYAQNQGEIRLGAISGVVTDALTRETIPGAVVTLIKRGGGLNVAPQYTDAKGRFVFPSLPTPATYQLRVSRIGYLDSAYAAGNLRSELGDSIELESGIWLSALSIVMQHPSAISGVVADSNGEPVVGASVRVLRRMPVASRWRIVGSNVSVTDDLGRYRVSNLVPGDYVVSVPSVQMSGATSGPVVPQSAGRRSAEAVVQSEGAAAGMLLGPFPVAPFSSASPRVYVTTYFPGASSLSNASVITLTAALERRGVDFHLRAQRAFRVSGSLQGVSPTGCLIRLLPADDQDGSAGMEIAVTRPDPRGAFSFPAVPPGQYTLQASSALAAYTFQPSAGSTVGRWS